MQSAPASVVVDTSAFIAVLMREPEAEFVASVFIDHQLIAPQSIDFEIVNALVMAFKR